MAFDLDRFRRAQDDPHAGFDVALAELRAGRKQSHWIWYVFPQLRGLGQSHTAVRYGVDGADEARAFLADPVLRGRLLRAVEAVHAQVVGRGAAMAALMGSGLDAHKLVSSLTLFEAVARRANAEGAEGAEADLATLAALATAVLDAAATQGIERCAFTLTRL